METAAVIQKFNDYISRNYSDIEGTMKRYAANKGISWDYDVFAETILKTYDKITKDGMEDTTDAGFTNYLFKACKTNLLRERQYSRVKQADDNVSQDSINELYDEYYNRENNSAIVKLEKDLRVDFKTLQVLLLVEKNFDDESYYLFRLKFLDTLTYRQLAEKTGVKDARNKVLTVLAWLRENAKDLEKEIDENFNETYDALLQG